jgi:putative ABC transport system permease protein
MAFADTLESLGAQKGQISWLILKRGLVQLAIGLGLGLAGAFAVSRLLERALFRVAPQDPFTFLAIAVVLTGVALAACLMPARRATRIDPLAAIHY